MLHEDHPWLTLLGGAATTAGALALTPGVTNPFLLAGLLAVGVAGSGAVGLGIMAGLLDGHDNRHIEGDCDNLLCAAEPQVSLAITNPVLQPDGTEMLFTDRLLAEREADLGDELAEMPAR